MNHYMGCLWFWVGNYESSHQKEERNWIRAMNLENESALTKYVNSLYFSIITTVTIGYGDVTPITNIEKIFTVVIALLSSVVFAYIMSSVSSILQDINRKKNQLIQKKAQINQFFSTHSVNNELQLKAKKYLEYTIEDEILSGAQSEELLNTLSHQLREQITSEVNLGHLKEIDFFSRHFSSQFLLQLSKGITERYYCTYCRTCLAQQPLSSLTHVHVAGHRVASNATRTFTLRELVVSFLTFKL